MPFHFVVPVVRQMVTAAGVLLAVGKINEMTQKAARAKAEAAQAKSARDYHAGQIELMKREQQHAYDMAQAGHAHDRDLQFATHSSNIDEKYWPLSISPGTYRGMGAGNQPQPLVLAYFPPRLPDDHLTNAIATANEISINDFLMRGGYSPVDPKRPVRFLGDWNRAGSRSNSALETLRRYGPNVPTALIQLDHVGDDLNLMAGCFGFLADRDSPPVLSASGKVAWGEHATSALRADMERLRNAMAASLHEHGIDPSLLGQQALLNLQLLNLEKTTGHQLDGHFRLTPDHLRTAAEIVQPGLHVLAAGMADFYHWTRYHQSPHLPSLLPLIASDFPDAMREELTQQTLRNYMETYSYLASMEGRAAPLMLLKLAYALAVVPGLIDSKSIEAVIAQAADLFRKDAKIPPNRKLVDYVRYAHKPEERVFFQQLAVIYETLGDTALAHAYANKRSFSSGGSRRVNSGPDEEEYKW